MFCIRVVVSPQQCGPTPGWGLLTSFHVTYTQAEWTRSGGDIGPAAPAGASGPGELPQDPHLFLSPGSGSSESPPPNQGSFYYSI